LERNKEDLAGEEAGVGVVGLGVMRRMEEEKRKKAEICACIFNARFKRRIKFASEYILFA